ncbi:MAG: Slp family lipoprotein [Symbiopectobacterium sp.]
MTLMLQMALGQEPPLGGRFVAVHKENDKSQTRLVIITLPLDRWIRPQLESVSEGRFITNVKGFLEPLDFQGRLVTTVVGSVSEMEQGHTDSRLYRFVVINLTGY